MKFPKRKRLVPNRLDIDVNLKDLEAVANNVRYVGSPEHKDSQNTLLSGLPPIPRPDASICPRDINDPKTVNKWLKEAILKGAVSELWEGSFPRYVWYISDKRVFMGRLINKVKGEYKGYPIESFEAPSGIQKLYE